MSPRRRRLPLRLPTAEAMGHQRWLVGQWMVWKQPSGIWCALAELDGDDESELPPLFSESLESMRWLIASWEKALAVSAARAAATAAKGNASLAHKVNVLDDLIDRVSGTVEDPEAEQEWQRHLDHRRRVAYAQYRQQQMQQEQAREEASRRGEDPRYAALNAAIDRELARIRQGAAA